MSDPSPYHAAGMDLLNRGSYPDKSKSYLFSLENVKQDNPYVGLARIDRSDSSQASRMCFEDYKAELMIGYNVPGGSFLFGKSMQLERPGDSSVKVLDDGWRFKFIKKF